MAEITAADVGKLRKMTNAGLMECKKALTEASGDLDAAVDILRKKGAASADKKAGRDANEGLIVELIADDAKSGVLVEVNCETDFVARNESFGAFCADVAKKIAADPEVDLEADRVAAVQTIGENVQIPRRQVLRVDGNGVVASYIHTGGKVGVLIEVATGKAETAGADAFKQLVRDLTLQVAAASPHVVSREFVSGDVIAKEKEIAAEQFKDKPAAAIENILKGKMEKFYGTYCLVDQGFVKDGEQTVKSHIASVAKELGDMVEVKRFVRFQVGEATE